ncbi:Branched-chain amino acid transport system 2 carrier protein [invertebrate metagenome]|uniref:Branched-chain amino acid transport system 2 carrier protein n=1 Tax=invertebrate metagenome TaxID=1711999 RepID=A0A2H9T588_9ZZZZ
MKPTDLLAICLAIFSMFMGAGNIIFPPMVGQQAGSHILSGSFGFLAGDIGLTLFTLIGVAIAGGPSKITDDLPPWAAKTFWIVLFSVLGPAFVVPRTAHVAWEIGVEPFINNSGELIQSAFIIAFLALAAWSALSPGRIINAVGRFMAPVLLLILAIIAVATVINPQGHIEAASGNYINHAFSEGMIQGYLTMDALGPLCLGWMIANLLRSKGVTSERSIVYYSAVVGLFATVGMGMIYSALLYLGATSHEVSPQAVNGAHILTTYISALFGTTGALITGIVIFLACLTTAVGTPGACAQYFHSIAPSHSYRWYIGIIYLISAGIAMIGLDKIITLSIPVLVTIYPVAIALTMTSILRRFIPAPVVMTRTTSLITLIFALLDGWKVSSLMPEAIALYLSHYLPLFDQSMGWFMPAVVAMVCSAVIGSRTHFLVEK